MQGLPLGYRSVSVLAKGEAEGFIYKTRLNLKDALKLPPLRVVIANHHRGKDTRMLPKFFEAHRSRKMIVGLA